MKNSLFDTRKTLVLDASNYWGDVKINYSTLNETSLGVSIINRKQNKKYGSKVISLEHPNKFDAN